MKISFSEPTANPAKADALVFLIAEDKQFPAALQSLDKEVKGSFAKALKAGRFAGKKGQVCTLPAPAPLNYHYIVLAGIGEVAKLTALSFESIGGALVPHMNAANIASACVQMEPVKGLKLDLTEAAARLAYGAHLRSYRFDKYHTKTKPEDKPSFKSLTLSVADSKTAAKQYAPLEKVAEGVFTTRNLVSEPANIIYPESLAEACLGLRDLGLEVDVLDEDEMHKLGMNALLAVGQGSANESKLVIMRYNGGKKSDKPLAFVGKGVTFDTGGISIKPSAGMEEMKWDMGGAGAVIGLMMALAGRKAKVNAVGVVGLVENMPSGNAQRPGDVVTSMSGQTIEVLNTDAEGRLVLSDALWYTQVNYKPKLVIDLATLTGAIIIALGSSRAGLFSNDEDLARQLFDAGKLSGEELWRMPLGDVYDKQFNSDIADMQNIGKEREAGSTMGAVFLQRFIHEGTPWAHLDIAGTAWTKKDLDTCPKGATAFGVRLLDTWVKENYES